LLTYLRLAEKPLGLLMNFGAETFKEGCKRVVNNHTAFAPSRASVLSFERPAGMSSATPIGPLGVTHHRVI